jgi:hypothetical protein
VYCVQSANWLNRKETSGAREYLISYRNYFAAARESLKSANSAAFRLGVKTTCYSTANHGPIGLGKCQG